MNSDSAPLVLALGILTLAAGPASAQSLDILGVGRAEGITPDGGTVLGGLYAGGAPNDVWIWSDIGGGSLAPLGGAQPRAISFDSGTVLGGQNATSIQTAELWKFSGGWSTVPGADTCGATETRPGDLSWDGNTVAGVAYQGCDSMPFRYTPGGSLTLLSTLGTSAGVNAISGSGGPIGGWDGSGFNIKKAAIWFPDGSEKWILAGIAPNPGGQGQVHGFSFDGTYAVGGAESISGLGAFVWDAVNGPTYLGEVPGHFGAIGVAVSEDGKTVVGRTASPFGGSTAGWIWTEADGMRSINDVMSDMGLSFPGGGDAFYVSDMTPDGKYIVGSFLSGGSEIGFRLTMPDPCGFTAYGAGASPANVLTLSGTGSTNVGSTPNLVTAGVNSPNAVVALALDDGSLPFGGGVLLLDATKVVATLTVPAVAGTATLPLPLPNDANLAGASLFVQSLSFDIAQPDWLAFSNGLELTICP